MFIGHAKGSKKQKLCKDLFANTKFQSDDGVGDVGDGPLAWQTKRAGWMPLFLFSG